MSNIIGQVGKFGTDRLRALVLVTAILFSVVFGFVFFSSHSMATTFNNPLVDAADLGDRGLVEKLLRQGIPPDSKGDFGTTALMRAAFRGNTDIIQVLIEAGAFVNSADIGGETALHLAAKNGHDDAVKSLIYYGASVDAPDKEQWTPLMRATLAKQPDTVKVLLDKGASVTALNNINESVLVHAAIAGVPEIAAMITGNSKATSISSEQKNIAVGLAKRKSHDKVEKVIEKFIDNSPKSAGTAGTAVAQNTPSTSAPEPLIAQVPSKEAAKKPEAEPTKKPEAEEDEDSPFASQLNPAPPLKPADGKSAEEKNIEGQAKLPKLNETKTTYKLTSPPQVNQETSGNITHDTAPTPLPGTDKTNAAAKPAALTPPSHQAVKDAVAANELSQKNNHDTADTLKTPATKSPKATAVKAASNAAESTFFVQLGNFNDDHSAELSWNRILASNNDVLSKLEPTIVEAILSNAPGDVVYRLRAGTMPTKNDADVTCKALRERKQECYVVEISNLSSGMAAASTAPNKKPADTKAELAAKPATPAKEPEQIASNIPSTTPAAVTPKSASGAMPMQSFMSSYPKLGDEASIGAAPLDIAQPLASSVPQAMNSSAPQPMASSAPQEMHAQTTPAVQKPLPWISGSQPARQEWKLPETPTQPTQLAQTSPAATPTMPNLPADRQVQSYPSSSPFPSQQQMPLSPQYNNQMPATQPALAGKGDIAKREAAMRIAQNPQSQYNNSDNFLENKDEIRNEVQEMTRENFFRKQGIDPPPQRQKKDYDEFYKQVGNTPKGSAVSEAVLVPDETYFTGNSQNNARTPGGAGSWLNIYNLPNEAYANDYGMRMFKYDESLGNPQISISKPQPGAGPAGTVNMRVGPLLASQASTLCNTVKAGGFSCNVAGSGGLAAPAYTAASSPYTSASPSASSDPYSSSQSQDFWINLGTFASNSEAEYYWMFIKEDNGDILSQLQYDISQAGDHGEVNGSVKLRTGPFNVKQRASQICSIMRFRNIACLVSD